MKKGGTMEGWIKLHRKLLDNPVIRDDNAYKLFTILLMLVDKKNGKYTTGRFQLSEISRIKPNTVYIALKRLEKKHQMITQESNNHFTTISIVNWHYYQGNGNTKDNNQITTRQQPDNTKQELRIKNKEYMREYLTSQECYENLYKKFPTIDELAIRDKCESFNDYCISKGKTYKNYYAAICNAIRSDKDKMAKRKVNSAPPPKPEITDSQRIKNLQALQEMKTKFLGG